ncbi:saccharopine dehydrogenase NADP-binding domain-containing protein [Jeotgalibacillus proteolyticus]|uniref:saccharopine dehydrogenase NADP-binding domain-containing protein n=1 Tax=Jeotgalibacillus proteolyticus TaxID=2082395 RepID=UPI003144FAE6
MIYGAYGYTGELIARKAAENGWKPVLAGRNEDKLKPLAEELSLDYLTFSLENEEQLIENIKKVELVLHCAGPFSVTSAPIIEACLAAGAHYLDITGEAEVFEHTHDQKQHKSRSCALLRGWV